MCLDESSRSLRASDTSSNCFSISLDSDTQTWTDDDADCRVQTLLASLHLNAQLTCYLLLESVDLAPQAPDLHLFVDAERPLPCLVLQSLHRLGRLCRGTAKGSEYRLSPSGSGYAVALDKALTLELATELKLLLLQPADPPLVGLGGQAVLKAALDI